MKISINQKTYDHEPMGDNDDHVKSISSDSDFGANSTDKTFYLAQGLGDLDYQSITPQDHVSALTFDKEGRYLSLGDNGGRVIIFTFHEEVEHEFTENQHRTFP